MVDQAQITDCQASQATASTSTGAQNTKVNGRTELPPQAMARNSAEFLSDVATLAELQGKLAVVDLKEGTAKLTTAVVLLGAGIVIALGSVPIALAALALAINEFARLSPAASFGIALLVGLVLAAVLALPAFYALKKNVWMFERSRHEWHRNLQWLRDTMKRLGNQPTAAAGSTNRW